MKPANQFNADQDWIRRMAAREDGAIISAGGFLASARARQRQESEAFGAHRMALARFVEFSRRRLGLTVEAFALQAGLQPSEVLQLEDEDAPAPESPAIFALAAFLHADRAKLMELAGLVRPSDDKLLQEAARFAAGARPLRPLSDEESQSLDDFARVMHE